jgi:dATP/dGTP diphosphohydrolase
MRDEHGNRLTQGITGLHLDVAAGKYDHIREGVLIPIPDGEPIPTYKEVYDPEHLVDLKPTNPKDIVGSDKVPLHLWPATATALGSLGLLEGALKYGRSNWRAVGVRASIYYDACSRHLNKWFEGEELDPDSGLPHLAHALACLAIIVDAKAADMLNDDRAYPGGYVNYIEAVLTPHVKRLKDKYADRHPTHYTIEGASE